MSTSEPVAPKPELDAPPILSGTRLFGTYEVEAELGSGGMGTVYRVRHTTTGEVRAAKVMLPQVTRDPRLEQLFTREARVLAQLRHPCVVRYLDLLRDGERLVLLMEYAEGEHLGQRLARGRMREAELETLLHHLADALAFVHGADVVHRDLSPDNIILRDGLVTRPTLIDFGIAVDDVDATSTIVEGFKGKLAYASPEQLGVGGTRIAAPSDIYSLGLLIAFAGSGVPLPMGRTLYEAVQRRSSVPSLPDDIPPRIAELVRRMLEPDPADRPTAVGLRDATSPSNWSEISPHDADQRRALPLPSHRPSDEGEIVTTLPPPAPSRSFASAERPVAESFSGASENQFAPAASSAKSDRRANAADQPSTAGSRRAVTAGGFTAVLHSAVAGLGMGIGAALWCAINLTNPVAVGSRLSKSAVASVAAAASSRGISSGGGYTALAPDRQRVMAEADRFAQAAWRMDARNATAPCLAQYGYRSDFAPGQQVRGVAYDWGGDDTPELFARKLSASYAAGSHSWNGVSQCTTGVDCSGFVGHAWGVRENGKLSTASMSRVARTLGGQWGDQLLPGDALNRPGRHVVLYAGRASDGRPIVYEALASAGRVVRNEHTSWARLRRYKPIRLRTLADG